jgi:hypothetical protein
VARLQRRLRRLKFVTPTARRPYLSFTNGAPAPPARLRFSQPMKNTHFWVLRDFPQFAESFSSQWEITSSLPIQTNTQKQ